MSHLCFYVLDSFLSSQLPDNNLHNGADAHICDTITYSTCDVTASPGGLTSAAARLSQGYFTNYWCGGLIKPGHFWGHRSAGSAHLHSSVHHE